MIFRWGTNSIVISLDGYNRVCNCIQISAVVTANSAVAYKVCHCDATIVKNASFCFHLECKCWKRGQLLYRHGFGCIAKWQATGSLFIRHDKSLALLKVSSKVDISKWKYVANVIRDCGTYEIGMVH